MKTILLKSGLIIFLLLFLSIGLQAQQNRFIYIQTENKQPFYITMDKKILSSSASGHIIISKLIDGVYKLSIGFPKNEWPEQNVTIIVKDSDAGFLLKNFGGSRWGLLNLQTMQVLMAEMKDNAKKIVETYTTGDEFAKLLASVVNDPSIGQVTRINNDSIPVNNSSLNKIEVKKADNEVVKPVLSDQTKVDAEPAKAEISKLMYDSTAEGINMFYLDKVNENVDTVKVFIPISRSAANIELGKQNKIPDTVQAKEVTKIDDSGFIDMELPNPNQRVDSGVKKIDDIVITEKRSVDKKLTDPNQDSTVKNSNIRGVMINSGCKKTATDKDFLKLRKEIAAKDDEYKMMLKAANKQFITTCFTTEQIKNLGVLFIKEEERYKFFVAAFPFVADTHNFASLQDQLTDNYYISRFKAMVSH